ncbi:hypothetical protein Tco_1193341 [Tanacetum coccineum]
MSNITDIKSVLTQKGLDFFCHKFHIPEDVHPQLPSPNQMIHEMLVGKIGVYTRFFEYANFRLPLSTFLVNVLRHFRINLSQLSVIAATKVSHFEILCRAHSIEPTVGLFPCFYVNSKNKGWMSFSKRSDSDAVCYTKPLDSLKHWNDHFIWVDSFACLASFPWHTDKNVSRDPFPKSTEFNADDYAVLVAHPAPFRKFPEPFLYLVGMSRYYTLDEDTYPRFLYDDGAEMDLFAFIHVVDPTKVKIVERERAEGERRLLDSTVGRVVSLLPVAPARSEGELEASVDKLFDKGGKPDQEDSAAGGGHPAEIESVTVVEDVSAENVTAERPKHPHKKRPAATDVGGSSHPPKKLRGDHGTPSGIATGGKSPSVLKELFASSILNVEGGDPTDSITGLNLRTVGPSERFVISSYSSHHSSTNASGAEVDFVSRSAVLPLVTTEAVVTSHAVSAHSVPVPETGTKITSSVHASMFHDSNFTETFNIGIARQAFLNADVRMRTEYCLSERSRLESECKKQADLLKARDDEIENLKARLLLKEAEATEAIRLRVQVSAAEAAEKVCADELYALKRTNVALKNERDSLNGKITELQSSVSTKYLSLRILTLLCLPLSLRMTVHVLEITCSNLRDQVSRYERLKEQIKEFQDAQMNIVNDKVAKLDADLLEMAFHLEEKFYPHLLTTIFGRSRAIEKGMQSGLSTGIDHGKVVRSLADVVAYNPAAEADYNVEDVMNLLHLEGPLTDAPRMSELQPDVEQLTLPIHRPKDQVVLGETSLSFALSVANSWVERIRKNVVAQRSSFAEAMVPLVEHLSLETVGSLDHSMNEITRSMSMKD